jgi:hypothetical protein
MPVPVRLVTSRQPATRRIVVDGLQALHDPSIARGPLAAGAPMAAG